MGAIMVIGAEVADRFGMMDDGYDHGWMWLWGCVVMLVLIATAALVIWAIVRSPQRNAPEPLDRAREVLAERFARGEITPDEYRERVHHLS